jgi:hypothetical protein
MASNFTVIYDANLFYPAFVRDVMLYLARAEIFRPRWTEDIHEEWMQHLARDRPDIARETLRQLREKIDQVVPDCLVHGYRALVTGLDLPDAGDRHVLAAAIKAGAQVIVTFNLRDFPAERLAAFDVQAQHPDEFIQFQKGENLPKVLEQLRLCRRAKQRPPYSAQDFIEKFRRHQMPLTATWLEENAALI